LFEEAVSDPQHERERGAPTFEITAERQIRSAQCFLSRAAMCLNLARYIAMGYERGGCLKLFLAAGVRFSFDRLPQLRIAAKPHGG